MASNALANFQSRLKEVEQLLEAHAALTRLKNAEAALNAGGQSLQNVAEVIQHLVSNPGPGRPPEVQALNSAGVALLSAHLQGFISDIYSEVARFTLEGKVADIESILSTTSLRGNPNETNITRLFSGIGYPKVLNGLTWQGMNNTQMRTKLRTFNELRNRIVHGSSVRVNKSTLNNYLAVFTRFAERLDAKLRRSVRDVTGENPW